MRTLAIGDIHGCLTALTTLLEFVAPAPDDRLITLGDYVDRGPDSRGVLDLMIDLHAQGRLIALRGNHEEMMSESRTDESTRRMWWACGGRETLASYGAPASDDPDFNLVPPAHRHFMEKICVDWFETENHFFVHANANANLPLEAQPREMLLWEALYVPCTHTSGKVMVCGHTRQLNCRPRNYGSTICIDTGAYVADGWLTCLDVDTGLYWQADQRGGLRDGVLSPPRY